MSLSKWYGSETMIRCIVKIWKLGQNFDSEAIRESALGALSRELDSWSHVYRKNLSKYTEAPKKMTDYLLDGLEEFYNGKEDENCIQHGAECNCEYNDKECQIRFKLRTAAELALEAARNDTRFLRLFCSSKKFREDLASISPATRGFRWDASSERVVYE